MGDSPNYQNSFIEIDLRIDLYFIVLLFLRGGGEKLPLLSPQRAKCTIGELDSIRWCNLCFKSARECKTMAERDDQTSSRILSASAPSRFESQVWKHYFTHCWENMTTVGGGGLFDPLLILYVLYVYTFYRNPNVSQNKCVPPEMN